MADLYMGKLCERAPGGRGPTKDKHRARGGWCVRTICLSGARGFCPGLEATHCLWPTREATGRVSKQKRVLNQGDFHTFTFAGPETAIVLPPLRHRTLSGSRRPI